MCLKGTAKESKSGNVVGENMLMLSSETVKKETVATIPASSETCLAKDNMKPKITGRKWSVYETRNILAIQLGKADYNYYCM